MPRIRELRCLWLAPWIAVGLASGAVTAQNGEPKPAAAVPGAQAPAQDEIELLRRALAQPGGGEARRQREAAIDALMRRREPRAHELLAEVIVRGDDPDETARFVLRSLGRQIEQPTDTVFGDPELRAQVLRVYVPAVVRLFARDPDLRPEFPVGALLLSARRFLEELEIRERREHYEALCSGADLGLARAALLAAGASRDTTLGPWIAARLDDPERAEAARAALSLMTFVEEPFADRAAFEAWSATHGELGSTELAESAAERWQQAAAAIRSAVEQRVVEQTSKLIAALARSDAPDWRAIAAEVMAPENDAERSRYLQVFCDVIGDRIAADIKLGGVVQDRQAFSREIRLRLEKLGDSPADFALHLEAFAYAAVREDPAQREAAENHLAGGLRNAAAPVRRAALRGMRRFSSVANRARVVAAAGEALDAGDTATLGEALACLRAPQWSAPQPADADRDAWIGLLRRVLDSTGLAVGVKEQALQIAVLRDPNGALVEQAFTLLTQVVEDERRDASLRKQALPRLLAFTRDPAVADAYVQTVVKLLGDSDPSIRRLAARQLSSLPEANAMRRSAWLQQIVARAVPRLRVEADENALRELIDCLLRAAEDPSVVSVVSEALVGVAHGFANKPDGEDALRRAAVIDGLRILAVGAPRDASYWLEAARVLAKLEARDALVAILGRHDVAGLAAGSDETLVPVMRLVIDAARLKPEAQPWTELAEEAARVRIAFDALERAGEPATGPGDRALRVTVLRVEERPAEVIDAGEAAIGDKLNPLGNDEKAVICRELARAYLDTADLDAAARCIGDLDALAPTSPDVLALTTELARRRIAAGSPAPAIEALRRVLDRTPIDTADWLDRFLLLADARLSADRDAHREAVLKDLHAEAPRFASERAGPELALRFESLLRRAQGSG